METKILKQIYFIRHGRTVGNEKNFYQDGNTPLSEAGKQQATFVGERFKNIPITAIIASDYLRTRDTAEAIAHTTGLSVEVSELFREIRRPSDIIGKEKGDVYAESVFTEIFAHEHEKEWRHKDEENLFDAIARARQALGFLRNIPHKTFAVVTHEMFTKALMSAMAVENDDARAVEFFQDIRFFMLGENTGVTVAELVEREGKEHFSLHIWNDHAHVG